MVRVPRSERRRLIQAADTGPTATAEGFDAGRSQVTRAVGGVVSAVISALGSAASSLGGAMGGAQGQQDQLSGTQAYTGFEADVSKNFNEQFQNTPPEQLTQLPGQITQDFDQRAAQMMQGVPESQQPKVAENVAKLRSQVEMRAQSEAIRRGYPAQEAMINKSVEQQVSALTSNPEDMEAAITRVREVTRQTQLPTWRQNEVFEKGYMSLVQAGRDGYLQRSDPDAAETFVSKWQNYAPQLGIDTQQPGAAPLNKPPTTEGGVNNAGPRAEISPMDRDAAIRTIYGEAANEGVKGQEAVANVIRNRMLTGEWGKTATDVVRAKGQFEPWMTSAGRQKMMALSPDSGTYKQIGGIVDRVFAGEAPDNTKGATHFFAPKAQAALGRNVPAWAKSPTAQIGGHNFYAPKGPAHSHGGPDLASAQKASPQPSQFADLKYTNQGAIRNQPLTPTLEAKVREGVTAVYGPGYRAEVFSGGQHAHGAKGLGARTGSTRHDLGKAADIHIINPQGQRVTGAELAKMGQYWAARGYGGVGLEMGGGGIHLDEHTNRATHWNYAGKGGSYSKEQAAIMQQGMAGKMPELRGAPGETIAQAKTSPAPNPRAPDWQAFRRNSDSAITVVRNRLAGETAQAAKAMEGQITTDFNNIKAGRPESADVTPESVGKSLGADRVETWQQQRQAARDYGAAMAGFESLNTGERLKRVESLRPQMPGPDWDFRTSLHQEAVKRFNTLETQETVASGRYGKELVNDAHRRLRAGQLDGDHLEGIRQHIPRRDYEAFQQALTGKGQDTQRATIDLSATIDDTEPPEFASIAQGYLRRGELSGETYTKMIEKNEQLRSMPRSEDREAIKRAFDPGLVGNSNAQTALGGALERALKEYDESGEPAAMIVPRHAQSFLAVREALGPSRYFSRTQDTSRITPDDVAMAAQGLMAEAQSGSLSPAQLVQETQKLRDWARVMEHEAALAGVAKSAPKTATPQKQSFRPQPQPQMQEPNPGDVPKYEEAPPEQKPRGEGEDPEPHGFLGGSGRIIHPGPSDDTDPHELDPVVAFPDPDEQRDA